MQTVVRMPNHTPWKPFHSKVAHLVKPARRPTGNMDFYSAWLIDTRNDHPLLKFQHHNTHNSMDLYTPTRGHL